MLGTTDNEALELRTANVIAGSHANEANPGAYAVRPSPVAACPPSTATQIFFNKSPNRVTDHYGTLGGGYNNQIGDEEDSNLNQAFATVNGGSGNTARGLWAPLAAVVATPVTRKAQLAPA